MKRCVPAFRSIVVRATVMAAWMTCVLPVLALAHEEEEKTSGLPQLDPSTYTSQLFWLAVTFALLYAIFSSKTLPALSGTLENRAEHIKNDTDAATKLKYEAEEAKKAYEKLLEGARSEATRTLSEANEAIKTKANEELQALRDRSAKESAALEKNLMQAKNKAKLEMQQICAEIASDISARIIGVKTDVKTAKDVIQSINNQEAA